MKYKITERQLKVVKEHIENDGSLNESGFWSGVKRIFVGKDFEDYAYDLENLLIEISENIYENEDIKEKVSKMPAIKSCFITEEADDRGRSFST